MKRLITALAVAGVVTTAAAGCGRHNPEVGTTAAVAVPPAVTKTCRNAERSFFCDADIIQLSGTARAFVLPPTNGPSEARGAVEPTSWVWYAPTLLAAGGTPTEAQHNWYADQLRAAGFAVVGVDVGESFGSPAGRASFLEFYQWLTAHGYATAGMWLLQSRGGLMGYSFLLEHPEAALGVAGIYPLLTYDDYAGPTAFAPAWGLSVDAFNAVKGETDPLAHAAEFTFPILHLHGDSDTTVHITYDETFVRAAPTSTLVTVPGQGHEYYSIEFFHSQQLLNFMLGVAP